jgi:ATP-dependent protease ClpP protease subunit
MQENLNLKQRQDLLKRIEVELSKRVSKKVSVISYIFNTTNTFINLPMNLSHISHIEDLVRVAKEDKSQSLALIIESLGGEANFPAELDERIRKYFDEFYIVGVNVLKSAATLLSLLSDKVIAIETASFGPVDPQLIYTSKEGQTTTIPARAVTNLIEKTLPVYVSKLPQTERVVILSSQNYILYQQAKDAINNVGRVVDRLAAKKKLTKKQLNVIKKKLIDDPLSHGNRIDPDELKGMGVSVEKLNVSDPLAELLTEYHRRAIRNLMMEVPQRESQGVILFESTKRSLQMAAHINVSQGPSLGGIPVPVQKGPVSIKPGNDSKDVQTDKNK